MEAIKIKKLRPSFNKFVSCLNKSRISFWLGRGLAEQITAGVIDDVWNKHDIDFHILKDDAEKIKNFLIQEGFQLRQNKFYKLQFLDSKQLKYELVFLSSADDSYCHQSKDKRYCCSKYLFGKKYTIINGTKIPIPYPLETYLCCLGG